MKTLIVSDLHSNAEALRTIFSHLQRKRFDQTACLGDFVGYGAEPNQVCDMMRQRRGRKLYIRGNHDRVAAGVEDGEGFNDTARAAALWTRDHLSEANRRFLQELPLGPLERDGLLFCHGSPHDEDDYVFTEAHAGRVLAAYDAPIILYGHTHLPAMYWMEPSGRVRGGWVRGEGIINLEPGMRYLINPGSVGQPRDRNPATSFAILDSEKRTIRYVRLPYRLEKTQASIMKAGLPRLLATRLQFGT